MPFESVTIGGRRFLASQITDESGVVYYRDTVEDGTPPATQLAKGGVDAAAGVVTLVAAANAARDKVDVLVDQTEASVTANGRARVWLSCGLVDPEAGAGGFLRPDGAWSEWTQEQVRVLADVACRVLFVEWGRA